MIDMDTRVRVARGIAKTETEASEVFQTLKRRGHPNAPLPTMSDGWGGIDNAMVKVYGMVPEYTGVGRPPTLKQPQSDWQYLQAVKQRENGRVVGVELRVVYGDEQEVLALWKKHGVCRTNPSYYATLQWSLGPQDAGFLKAAGDVSRVCCLGGPDLQSGTTAQNATGGGLQ
jgi:hypothetical protein